MLGAMQEPSGALSRFQVTPANYLGHLKAPGVLWTLKDPSPECSFLTRKKHRLPSLWPAPESV